MRWIGGVVTAAVLTVLVAAPSESATLHLDISGMAFAAASAPVHMGDVIVWSNRDFVDHTVTARDGSFDATIPAGGTGRITLRHPPQHDGRFRRAALTVGGSRAPAAGQACGPGRRPSLDRQ